MMTELGNDMSEEEAQDMIFNFDDNHDGAINFQEFVKFMLYDV